MDPRSSDLLEITGLPLSDEEDEINTQQFVPVAPQNKVLLYISLIGRNTIFSLCLSEISFNGGLEKGFFHKATHI